MPSLLHNKREHYTDRFNTLRQPHEAFADISYNDCKNGTSVFVNMTLWSAQQIHKESHNCEK